MTAGQAAIRYLLDLVQENPDVRYVVGPGTEAFRRLVVAEAELEGRPVEQVERRRTRDLQPMHRWRPPEVLELRKHVEVVRERLFDDEVEDADRELERWLREERARAVVQTVREQEAAEGT